MQMLEMAREQHGCRQLQRLIVGEPPERLQLLLDEILPETGALMVDPFGNYLVQKILEVASGAQRHAMLTHACSAGLCGIARNTHGTRAVQKLVEAVCFALSMPASSPCCGSPLLGVPRDRLVWAPRDEHCLLGRCT